MSIVLDQLTKRYGAQAVVNNLSLEVGDGELLVLLGPSGSGKSTVLRMIAGLSPVDSGRIVLHGRDVTPLPPQKRGVGFVFQSYALFRGMTVAENVEFALSIRRIPRPERRKRREELLDLVGLSGLAGRMPGQLSGGQQQRVALARALAHQPEVLLLDEPFGALDARIRTELRRSIRAIQRELKLTTVFVTHDQEEAFELADRVAVLHYGRLLEVGPPEELYLRPETEVVATFLGSANLMVGECSERGVRLGPVELPLATRPPAEGERRRVQVLFRPEDVAIKDSEEALGHPSLGQGIVEQSTFVGSVERLRLRLPPLPGVRPIHPPAPFGGDYVVIEASRSQHNARRFPVRPGDRAWVGVRRVHALAHPGLGLLLVADDGPAAPAALELGAEIARHAHARVTLLAAPVAGSEPADRLQTLREQLGSGLAALETLAAEGSIERALAREVERRPYDLAILGLPATDRVEAAEAALAAGEVNVLLVPGPAPPPTSLLICVAVGEPGKDDVRFAGRLARHLGATVEVLTVLAAGQSADQAERFLAASVRSLARLGVQAKTAIRRGAVVEAVLAESAAGAFSLLVLGAPLGDGRGRPSLSGVVARLVAESDRPVLIVRTREEAP